MRVRPTLRNIVIHTIAVTAGLALAWAIVGQAWIEFDSLVPMWVTAAVVIGVAVGLVAWRQRKVLGLALGLIVSALVSVSVFTLLSSGPSID